MAPECDITTAEALKARLTQREQANFNASACFSTTALRRYAESRKDTDYRLPFAADADRILNSMAFSRYPDKTQVFSLIHNDHLTHRILHVQMVARVARTIGRYLGLNTDLIEAASLGHDIGHPPFGHDGETFLSQITQANGVGAFHHNIQSIQFLDRVERNGKGWNLTLQTLDAILCHNGEAHCQHIRPAPRNGFNALDKLIADLKSGACTDAMPMTLEGCVVRMSDTISYIGRDLEDAVRLGIIIRDQIPKPCAEYLGTTQGTIVFNLVTDIIQTSLDQDFIGFSKETAEALETLKAFNYQYIYKNPAIKAHLNGIQDIFIHLYHTYLSDLETENLDSVIFTQFLKGMDQHYRETHRPGEIVRDFIAGMTDSYFIRQAPAALRPKPITRIIETHI